MDKLFAAVLFVFALVELRKGLLILIKNQTHIIFAISISAYILRFLQSSQKQNEAMENYKKTIKIYGVLNIIASVYMIIISVDMMLW